MDTEKIITFMTCKKDCKAHPEAIPVLELNPEGAKFFGKWLCGECGRFLSHSTTPKNQSEMLKRQQTIRNMMYNLELNDEELHNLMMIYSKPSLKYNERDYYNKFAVEMETERLNKLV